MSDSCSSFRIAVVAHNLRSAGGLSVGRNIVATLPKIAPMYTYLMIVPEGYFSLDFDGVYSVEVRGYPKVKLLRCRL